MRFTNKIAVKSTVIPINCRNFNITLFISKIRRVSTYLNYVRFHLFFKLAIEGRGIYDYDVETLDRRSLISARRKVSVLLGTAHNLLVSPA